MVLNIDRKDIGLNKDNFSYSVFVIVMEMGESQ